MLVGYSESVTQPVRFCGLIRDFLRSSGLCHSRPRYGAPNAGTVRCDTIQRISVTSNSARALTRRGLFRITTFSGMMDDPASHPDQVERARHIMRRAAAETAQSRWLTGTAHEACVRTARLRQERDAAGRSAFPANRSPLGSPFSIRLGIFPDSAVAESPDLHLAGTLTCGTEWL
jgi:hypothetical protein